MKKLLIIIEYTVLFTFFCDPGIAENRPLKIGTPHNYDEVKVDEEISSKGIKDLSVGNKYYIQGHYHSTDGHGNVYESFYGIKEEVIGDTLINFLTYAKIFNFFSNDLRLERADSLCIYYYDIVSQVENILLNYNVIIGDTIYYGDQYFIVNNRDTSNVIGLQLLRLTAGYYEEGPFITYDYFIRYAEAFGLIENFKREIDWWYWRDTLERLVGALIDNSLYGDTTLINGVVPIKSKTDSKIPTSLVLYQNYPNPFNQATTIKYDLPIRERVTLKIYDVLGREVNTLVNAVEEASHKSVYFESSNLVSGIYYYQLMVGEFVETKKFLLMK